MPFYADHQAGIATPAQDRSVLWHSMSRRTNWRPRDLLRSWSVPQSTRSSRLTVICRRQACADDPQVAFHAVRNLARLGRGLVTLRWLQLGFGRTSTTSSSSPRRGT